MKQNKTNIALKTDGGGNNGVPITNEVIERTITITINDIPTGAYKIEMNEPFDKELEFFVYKSYTKDGKPYDSSYAITFYPGDTLIQDTTNAQGKLTEFNAVFNGDEKLPEFTTIIDEHTLLYHEERKQFKVDDILIEGIYIKADDDEYTKVKPDVYNSPNSIVVRDENARIYTRSNYGDYTELEDFEAAPIDAVYSIANAVYDERGSAADLTDYVKNTDYATADTAGVVKVRNENNGLKMYSQGHIGIVKASDIEITQKASSQKPIVPQNLDYAVKTSITTNKNALTDTEKNSAQKWLGVDTAITKAVDDAIKNMDKEETEIAVEEVLQTSWLSFWYEENEYASFGLDIYPPLNHDLQIPIYRDLGLQDGEGWWEGVEWITIPAGDTSYYGQFMTDGALAIPETVSAFLNLSSAENERWIQHDDYTAEYITDKYTLIKGDKIHASRIFVETGEYEGENPVYTEVATKRDIEKLREELRNGGII